MARSANIRARKRLSELYARGCEIRFGAGEDGKPYTKTGPFLDDKGEPVPATEDEVAIWVQPPSPLQREQALRDAQASRSRSLLRAKRDEDSEDYLVSMSFIADMDDETLIDYVLMVDMDERRQEAIRDVLARDHWKDFQDLQDAMRQWAEAENQDDDEWKDLLAKDREYGEEVSQRQTELTSAAREVLAMTDRQYVEKRALSKRSELTASQVFMSEYERQMMFYAARDPEDHGVLFYESARDLADEPMEVQKAIADALADHITEGVDAKN